MDEISRLALGGAAALFAALASAQEHAGHTPPAADQAEHAGHTSPAADHAAPGAHAGHGAMRGALGGYPMTREASGTAWQPESAPSDMEHWRRGSWDLMAEGVVTPVYTAAEAGARGDDDELVETMAML